MAGPSQDLEMALLAIANQPDAIEKARKELEDRIVEHTRLIYEMKNRLNALVPIARLPPEILTEVFLQYRAVTRPSWNHPSTNSWIRITHVCHQWREIALHAPRLWSEISPINLECTREMLSRSKHVHLDIKACGRAQSAALEFAFREIHRIRNIALHSSARLCSGLPDGAGASAPQLQSLVLKDSSHVSSYPLPPFFTHREFPQLEELQISGYQISSWSTKLFCPTLKKLVVTGGGTLQLADLIRALEGMSSLEHLDLQGAIPTQHNSSGFPPVLRVITLDRLVYLRLVARAVECVHFLDHLCVPTSARILLEFTSFSTNGADFPLLHAPIASKLTGLNAIGPATPLLSFAIRMRPSHTEFCGWTTAQPLKLLASEPNPHISILIPTYISMRGVLDSFCGSLPLSEVQSLYVGHFDYVFSTKAAWEKAFAQMRSIRALRVVGDSATDISKVLTPRMVSEPGPSKKGTKRPKELQVPFPQLEELMLDAVLFRKTLDEDDENQDDTYRKALRRSLRARRKHHAGVKRLIIEHCLNMDDEDVDYLRSGVDTLMWDGVVDYYESETDEEEESMYDEWDDVDDFYPPYPFFGFNLF